MSSSSISLLAALAVLAGCVLAPSAVRADRVPFGYQSGLLSDLTVGTFDRSEAESFNDDSYAASVRYDPKNGLLYVTGGTYNGLYFGDGENPADAGDVHLLRSDCFFAALKLPDAAATGPDSSSAWQPRSLHSFRLGAASSPAVCSSLFAFDADESDADPGEDSKRRLVLVGHTEEGGYLTGLREVGENKATVYGYALDVEVDLEGADRVDDDSGRLGGAHEVFGGRLFHASKVQYPIAVAVPPNTLSSERIKREVMYVAVMDTDDDHESGRWEPSPNVKRDITAGVGPDGGAGSSDEGAGGWHRYGRSFDLTIMKLRRKTEAEIAKDSAQVEFVGGPNYPFQETMKVLWEQPFATAEEGFTGAHPGVTLAGLLYVPHARSASLDQDDFLLMAGTTKGYGSAFGSELRGNDRDGFLTKLRIDTGEELKPAEEEGALRSPHSVRIQSQNGQDDVIHGICIQPDEGDVRSAYVAGSTTGIMDPESLPGDRTSDSDPLDPLPAPQAFVLKVDLDSMEVEWKRQFGSMGGQNAHGTGCAVTPDGRAVYLAGAVADGGVLGHKQLGETEPNGKDDIFVIQLDATTGEAKWMRQIGTSADDWLARGSGIVADEEGRAILYGSTRGSLMRWRGDTGGDHDRRRADEHEHLAADVFVMTVSKSGEFRTPVEQIAKSDGGDLGVTIGGSAGGKVVLTSQNQGGRRPLVILLTACLVILGLALVFFGAYRAKRAERKHFSHEVVTKYLGDFDEVDVAIRGSATGGWHGMYGFGNDHSRLMADLGNVTDEVTITLSQISRDGGSSTGGGGSVSGGLIADGGGGSVAYSSSAVVEDALFFKDDGTTASARQHRIGFGSIHDDDIDQMHDDENEEAVSRCLGDDLLMNLAPLGMNPSKGHRTDHSKSHEKTQKCISAHSFGIPLFRQPL